jgi:hypothetical protein
VVIVVNLRKPGAVMLVNRGRRSGFADIESYVPEVTATRVVLEPGERKAVEFTAGIFQITATADIVVSVKEQS